MKYIKTFETIMRAPKVGDYIITNKLIGYGKFDGNYNIGQIVKIENDFYFVKIINEEEEIIKGHGDVILKLIQINCWSNNLDNIKLEFDAKKYNL